MEQTVSIPVAPASAYRPAVKTSRLLFIDALRTGLVVLVVVHHVALVYGAGAPFYYFEPPFTAPRAFVVLLTFILVNQSWFMGAFFLLAGYFTPRSLERKGPASFLKDRLLRLGIPLVIFYFVLSPLSWIGLYQMPSELTGITAPLGWQAYPKLVGMGPMWFVAMLLLFSIGYAAWRALRRSWAETTHSEPSHPSYLAIVVFTLALAAASYLLRMVIPLGREVLGFPTLAYLPQYMSFFVIGTLASRQKWFSSLPNSMGLTGFVAALLAGVLLFPLAFSGQPFSLAFSPVLGNAFGNAHWQSAIYALWDSVFAVGLCLGLITSFRTFFNQQGRLGQILSHHSYTVYIFHIPIIVCLALALKGVELTPLLKFAVASTLILPTCFAVAYIVRKTPFASKIL